MRKPAAGALEHRAAFQNQRHAITLQYFTGLLLPAIGYKWLTVERRNGVSDPLLQAEKEGTNVRQWNLMGGHRDSGSGRLDGPVPNVFAVMGAVEINRLRDLIGAVLRGFHRIAQCRHAEHPPAGSQRCAVAAFTALP